MKKQIFIYAVAFTILFNIGILNAFAEEQEPYEKNEDIEVTEIENDSTENNSFILSDEVVNVLTQEDYAKAYEILIDIPNKDTLTEEELNKEAVTILTNIYNDKTMKDINTNVGTFAVAAFTSIPSKWNELNKKEKALAKKQPLQASQVYYATGKAENETDRLFKYGNSKDATNGNAFKHSYWNALMTREMGAKNAKTWADAHEDGKSLTSNNTIMDFRNNKIGRDTYSALWDKNKKSVSVDTVKKEMLKKIDQGKLWRIVNKKLVRTNNSENINR